MAHKENCLLTKQERTVLPERQALRALYDEEADVISAKNNLNTPWHRKLRDAVFEACYAALCDYHSKYQTDAHGRRASWRWQDYVLISVHRGPDPLCGAAIRSLLMAPSFSPIATSAQMKSIVSWTRFFPEQSRGLDRAVTATCSSVKL